MKVTFIVPAYNEEENLRPTVEGIEWAAHEAGVDWEVRVVDDASTDRSGAVADDLAAADTKVVVLHNRTNRGLGYNYLAGVAAATGEYVMMVPGDNEIRPETVRNLLRRIGHADIVIPYIANYEARTPGRALLSRLFTIGLNLLFGLRLRYYNGIVIHRTELIRAVPIRTHGFSYQAEALVRLLRSGHSYVQAPMVIKPRDAGASKALRPRNVARVTKSILSLFLHVRLLEGSRYRARPVEVADPFGGAP